MTLRRLVLAIAPLVLLTARTATADGTGATGLSGPAATPTAPAAESDPIWRVPVGSSPTRGPKHALITMVVFSDFECGFCKRHAATLDAIASRYPRDVRIVFKHRPLPFHPMAEPAAHFASEAFHRRGEGAFWKAHDALFAADELSAASLEAIARDLRLDPRHTLAAVDRRAHEDRLAEDELLADSVGANGTPTTFINGVKVTGARPLEFFVPLIERQLEHAKTLRAAGTPSARLYDSIVKEGKSIDLALARRAVPEPTDAQPTRGPHQAPVTLHLFTDFECPYCGLARETLARVERRYAKQLRIVYHSLPLSSHPHARDAAAFALEAFAQQGPDGFWRAHDRLFANQRSLTRTELTEHARALGLDSPRMEAALADGRHNLAIDADLQLASEAGIDGTPCFVVNGYEIAGAQPFAAFRAVIDRALREAGPTPTKPAPPRP